MKFTSNEFAGGLVEHLRRNGQLSDSSTNKSERAAFKLVNKQEWKKSRQVRSKQTRRAQGRRHRQALLSMKQLAERRWNGRRKVKSANLCSTAVASRGASHAASQLHAQFHALLYVRPVAALKEPLPVAVASSGRHLSATGGPVPVADPYWRSSPSCWPVVGQ